MGQDEILKLLKRKRKWTTNKEIAEKLKNNMSTTNVSLKKLVKQDEIVRKQIRAGNTIRYEYRIQKQYKSNTFIKVGNMNKHGKNK